LRPSRHVGSTTGKTKPIPKVCSSRNSLHSSVLRTPTQSRAADRGQEGSGYSVHRASGDVFVARFIP
jgi:hypothetical protein